MGSAASSQLRSEGDYESRCARLERDLAGFDRLAIAFSGGVDSSVLLAAALGVLGSRVTAVIADSPSLARRELKSAERTARALGATLVRLDTSELEDPDYVANAGARCYHCKRALFDAMLAWAARSGVRHLAFGEIADDLLDDRPGRRAAAESHVHAPLAKAGFEKEDVRRWAREHGLEVADKPASACLASRVPVGRRVTRERLARIERAEDDLHALGLRVLRVRDLGQRARLEVGREELAAAQAMQARLEQVLEAAGFPDGFELDVYRSPLERARPASS